LSEKRKKVIIYRRVSTSQQSTESQIDILRDYSKFRNFEIVAEYEDVGSGMKNDRENYQLMLNEIRKGKCDALLVFRIDRVSRSVKELVSLFEELKTLGVEFISYSESLDSGSHQGALLFTIVSAFAQMERNILIERTKVGIENARKKGKILGRPKVSETIKNRIIELYKKGNSYKQILKDVGISKSKYFEIVKEYNFNQAV
jgi:DNA invertase Pin-like site-specific DNA recombinase